MKKNLGSYIAINSGTQFGQPVIAGTRTPVATVIGKLAGGMTVEDVMQEYDLTKEAVLASLQYAADIVANEEVMSV